MAPELTHSPFHSTRARLISVPRMMYIQVGQVTPGAFPNGVPSGMPANYINVSKGASCIMSGHRTSRVKLFEYLMHCEIDWRVQQFLANAHQAIAQGLASPTNVNSGAKTFFQNIVNASTNHYQDVGTPVTLPSFVPTTSSTPCPAPTSDS